MKQADGVRGSTTTSSPRCTPIDVSATSDRVSDFGDYQLIVQVCHGEHDLAGIN